MSNLYSKLAIACMLLGCSSIGLADDAEVFFNKELQHVKPNVIFLLDSSGSMAYYTNDDKNSGNNPNRMDALKDALKVILVEKTGGVRNIEGVRAGIISFASYLHFINDLVDVDAINNENVNLVTKTKVGSSTVLRYPIINQTEGYRTTSNAAGRLIMPYSNAYSSDQISQSSMGATAAYRFSNILLKQSASADSLIEKATLTFTGILPTGYRNPSATFRGDLSVPSPYITTAGGFMASRLSNSSSGIRCNRNTSSSTIGNYTCDVTAFVRQQIKNSAWEDGQGLNFYITTTNEYIAMSNSAYPPYLTIQLADESLIAENKRLYTEDLLEKGLGLESVGGTNTVLALNTMSNYISSMTKKEKQEEGPYHDTVTQLKREIPSPIEEGCQLTHVILMTDGEPQANYNGKRDYDYVYNNSAAKYMGYSGYNNCRIVTSVSDNGTVNTKAESYSDSNKSEACGRAIASWMANIDQTKNTNGANYIYTHTIGFALDASNSQTAKTFLKEVATVANGKSYSADTTEGLVEAFKEIISDARATDGPSASGRVTMSTQSSYEQRNEVFYAMYTSRGQNYWQGNMKGFLLKYVNVDLKDGTKSERPILVAKNGTTPAMGSDGVIINGVSSFWSSGDGGSVGLGGVAAQLVATARKQYIMESNGDSQKALNDTNTTTMDLGLTGSDASNRKKGLLEFIKGYEYQLGGGAKAPAKGVVLKIGDSARSGVTLATYGCTAGNTVKLQECTTLNQRALLASNDGFIRGYDTASGAAIYEYMPKEMLPLISQLQAATVVNYDKSRFYGVDGNIVIYHKDTNKNDYIDGEEPAYAYAVAGRGGPYIYGLDISSPNTMTLAWKITGGEGSFVKLGDAWSVPSVGNMKVGGVVTPVLVFGGGYDKKPTETDTFETRTASKGNAVYIVNAETGTLIKELTNGISDMNYSVPSSIALVLDESDDQLITDIVFGDTGGQVWRFYANNIGATSSFAGGVVARLGSGGANSRKFFQKPSIYQYEDGTQKMISINIGSGFRNHPLSTDIYDRIYSLRLPKENNPSTVLTESDLANNAIDYGAKTENLTGNLSHGFMITLQTNGEKVITDGFASFGRLVFNTFVPVATDRRTCKPRVGLQRTYVYDLLTGESMLQTVYLESNVSSLPADVTYYCKGDACTIVPSTDILSAKELPRGKDDTDSPLLFNPNGGVSTNFIKTGSTDLFDISPR